jgi:hypothetical protein
MDMVTQRTRKKVALNAIGDSDYDKFMDKTFIYIRWKN